MARAWFKAVFTGLAMAALAGSAFAADTIKVGVPGAHSGDLASYGLPSLNAVRIVVDKVNAAGGVLGKQVEVIAQDDQCKPEMATNAATKLLSEGVNVVMGGICSGATKAALPIYTDAKIVSMSPSATTPELTESGVNPLFFRTIASDRVQGDLAAAFVQNTLKKSKVALLHDKGDYGRGFVDFTKDYFAKNGNTVEVVLYEGITPGAVDYSSILRKVRQAKADVIIFGGYHPEASKLVQQMKKNRLDIPFVSDDGVRDATLIKVAGPDAEGVYATGLTDMSSLPLFQQAKQEHIAKYNSEPGLFYENAYAAALALLNAVEKAGTATDSAKIMEALRTEYVDTPIGKLRFDAKGDAEGVAFSIYQVKDGKFVELK